MAELDRESLSEALEAWDISTESMSLDSTEQPVYLAARLVSEGSLEDIFKVRGIVVEELWWCDVKQAMTVEQSCGYGHKPRGGEYGGRPCGPCLLMEWDPSEDPA